MRCDILALVACLAFAGCEPAVAGNGDEATPHYTVRCYDGDGATRRVWRVAPDELQLHSRPESFRSLDGEIVWPGDLLCVVRLVGPNLPANP